MFMKETRNLAGSDEDAAQVDEIPSDSINSGSSPGHLVRRHPSSKERKGREAERNRPRGESTCNAEI